MNNKTIAKITAGTMSVIAIMALSGCADDSSEALEQAVATDAYNTVSACYNITNLENNANTNAKQSSYNGINGNGIVTNTGVYITDDNANNNNVIMVRGGGHGGGGHAGGHSGGGHVSGGSHGFSGGESHGFSESGTSGHSTSEGIHEYHSSHDDYTGSDTGSEYVSRDTVNNGIKANKLADTTSVEPLKNKANDSYDNWFSHPSHPYYIPMTHHYMNDNSNANNKNDKVAYFLSDYILGINENVTSMKVSWKYDNESYTGEIKLFQENNDKIAKLTSSYSDKTTFNESCIAKLPTVDEVQKQIDTKNE